ncbi:LSM domain-containing protein [Aureococcus anophagefferens]|nr:LSM domain-containing protein [Aureococcus anophagefferens]
MHSAESISGGPSGLLGRRAQRMHKGRHIFCRAASMARISGRERASLVRRVGAAVERHAPKIMKMSMLVGAMACLAGTRSSSCMPRPVDLDETLEPTFTDGARKYWHLRFTCPCSEDGDRRKYLRKLSDGDDVEKEKEAALERLWAGLIDEHGEHLGLGVVGGDGAMDEDGARGGGPAASGPVVRRPHRRGVGSSDSSDEGCAGCAKCVTKDALLREADMEIQSLRAKLSTPGAAWAKTVEALPNRTQGMATCGAAPSPARAPSRRATGARDNQRVNGSGRDGWNIKKGEFCLTVRWFDLKPCGYYEDYGSQDEQLLEMVIAVGDGAARARARPRKGRARGAPAQFQLAKASEAAIHNENLDKYVDRAAAGSSA